MTVARRRSRRRASGIRRRSQHRRSRRARRPDRGVSRRSCNARACSIGNGSNAGERRFDPSFGCKNTLGDLDAAFADADVGAGDKAARLAPLTSAERAAAGLAVNFRLAPPSAATSALDDLVHTLMTEPEGFRDLTERAAPRWMRRTARRNSARASSALCSASIRRSSASAAAAKSSVSIIRLSDIDSRRPASEGDEHVVKKP